MALTLNGDDGIAGVDGSAATPAIQGTDSNTGISFGTDTVNVVTGGSARATVDSSGRLGIGTTSPQAAIDIFTSTGPYFRGGSDNTARQLVIESSTTTNPGDTHTLRASSGTGVIAFANIDDTERARIDSGGRLLIGTTSRINNEKGLGVAADNQNGGTGVVHIRNTSSSSADTACCLVCSKTATTTSSSARFIQFSANNMSTPMGGIVGNGASNVQFASISDIRDKENIEPLTGSLDKVKSLEVVSFDWKNTGEHVKAGFIAQNVETVFPEYVVDNMASEGQEARKGITGGLSSGYVAVLTAALQEAIGKIEALETRVAQLEGGAS